MSKFRDATARKKKVFGVGKIWARMIRTQRCTISWVCLFHGGAQYTPSIYRGETKVRGGVFCISHVTNSKPC